MFLKACFLHLTMPSILNTPTNKIPIHFFHLPITQREILLVNILTDPDLYDRFIASALFHDDPIFPQAITLFCNYILIRQLFAHLTVPCLPIQIAKAFNPVLSIAHTAMLVLLVDRRLDHLLGILPRDHLANILRTVLLSLSEELHCTYYSSGQVEEGVPQHPENGIPPTLTCQPPFPSTCKGFLSHQLSLLHRHGHQPHSPAGSQNQPLSSLIQSHASPFSKRTISS